MNFFLLITKCFDWFGCIKEFIKPDIINAYYEINIKKGNKKKIIFKTKYDYLKYQVI